ncbi:MAG: hypothetical protein JRG82_16050 [Deltaproteobacteria bacterium]|nr:hypothetical protein [Deltaproteobacteria bacterium]
MSRYLSLVLLGALAACGGKKTYSSLGEFTRAQEEEGFVVLGMFDDSWPATIVEERESRDEISFTRANGTAHRYPGYAGYTLKVVRLKSKDGGEGIIVFRSKERE